MNDTMGSFENRLMMSIIVPIYNVEKYLDDCLISLTSQNIPEDMFEIICIDDGSSDNSGEIIDRYASMHTNIIVIHKSNGGVSSARNMGLKNARGEYIWFVDSDDYISVDSIGYICNVLKKNKPDVLQVGMKAFLDGSSISNKGMLQVDEEAVRYYTWIQAEIMKSDIIKNNHIEFDINVHWGEDDIFSVFVYQKASIIIDLNKTVYFYRQREGSALHSEIRIDNFEKILLTYQSDLEYAKNYSFFDYKREGVYKRLPLLLTFIAQQPFIQANSMLKQMRAHNLFPMHIYKNVMNAKEEGKISGAKKIRILACQSYFFYLILRLYIRIKN